MFWYQQVTGPSGEQIRDFRDKTSEMFEFVANKEGVYRFCFTNKSPFYETIDFDVHSSYFFHFDQEHAKDGKRLYENVALICFVFSYIDLIFFKFLCKIAYVQSISSLSWNQ